MRTTAIVRRDASVPARWLSTQNLLLGKCLDYGAGRGIDALHYDMDEYDPQFQPQFPTKLYNTITCTYVLNIVPKKIQLDIISKVSFLLNKDGTAYFTVRRDIPKEGTKYQYYVELSLPCIREISTYAIYKLHNFQGK